MIKDCVISYFIGETACIETRIHVNLSRSQYFYQLIRFFFRNSIYTCNTTKQSLRYIFSKRKNFDMFAVLDNFEDILFHLDTYEVSACISDTKSIFTEYRTGLVMSNDVFTGLFTFA